MRGAKLYSGTSIVQKISIYQISYGDIVVVLTPLISFFVCYIGENHNITYVFICGIIYNKSNTPDYVG